MLVRIAHLTLAALWLGSMAYSLGVVQPKVARFFTDEQQREDFLATLAQDNRWRVVALVAGLLLTGVVALVSSHRHTAICWAAALTLYATAAAIFVYVSWRHWPARVFALPQELPRFRRRLLRCAAAMLLLVGSGFLITLAASVQ
jgi:hypothetical protein